MGGGKYSFPSADARFYRERLRESERRVSELMADCAGAAAIESLEAKVAKLESGLGAEREKGAKLRDGVKSLRADKKALKADLAASARKIRDLEQSLGFARRRLEKAEDALEALGGREFALAEENRRLRSELEKVKEKLQRATVKLARFPENSSLPPSSNSNRKRIPNSRVRTGHKPGGQPGHPGHPRRRRAADSVVAIAPPTTCPGCGGGLVPVGEPRERSVTELRVAVTTTAYLARDCRCERCGRSVPAAFPAGMSNESNYGPNVKAVVTSLVNGCNASIDNARGILRELTGGELDVSKGSCSNFLRQLSSLAEGEIAAIGDDVAAAPVVGSDATFTRSAGRQSYVYTFNTPDAALFAASDVKGSALLEGSPIDGGAQVVVHDHDTSYYGFGGAHAECNVHVLRYLKGVIQNEPGRTWAAAMAEVLKDALAAAKAASAEGLAAVPDDVAAGIEARYDAALDLAEREYGRDGPFNPKYKPEGMALANRLREYKANHLLFLHATSIPFDNNASERLLRCAKKKVKQSGGFRSTPNGEQPYCDFLTITQTAKLRGESPYGAVLSVFEGKGGGFAGETAAGTV